MFFKNTGFETIKEKVEKNLLNEEDECQAPNLSSRGYNSLHLQPPLVRCLSETLQSN